MTVHCDRLRRRVAADLAARGVLPPGAPILIGLSGGRDSVVLAHLLADLRAAHAWQLRAVHFDHGLRGPAAAEADRVLCEKLCERLQMPLTVAALQLDPAGPALEEAARNARLAAFRRLAVEYRMPLIATAHHADDRVETVLFRLLRGTGLRGLPGIQWRRAEPLQNPPTGLGFSMLQFHRPLLAVWRSEITAYARAAGLAWIDDATNATDQHTRNRLRHQLLPHLAADYNPEVGRHLWDLAEDAADWLAAVVPSDVDVLPALAAEADGGDPPATVLANPPDLPATAWPWPALPLVIDGATLLGLGRAQAIAALQTLLEHARHRLNQSAAPIRVHYEKLYALLTDPAAPNALSLPGGWQVRRSGNPPHARLTIDRA